MQTVCLKEFIDLSLELPVFCGIYSAIISGVTNNFSSVIIERVQAGKGGMPATIVPWDFQY